MRYFSFLYKAVFVLLVGSPVFTKAQEVSVFRSGTDGFKSFRIPAMIKMANGDLMAFAEGRVNGTGDFGNVKIVMRKSADHGKTWSVITTVVSNDTLQAGNPSPVLDLTDPDYPKGRIFLFYNTGNAPEDEVRKGEGLREVWYKTSADGGLSWSAPVDITLHVHKPKQPDVNKAYHFEQDWRSYANGPGHAIQLNSGLYEGRIYVAANHSAGKPLPHYADGRIHGFYTDDHGRTFKLSEDIATPGGNESMAVELSGNQLMINARNQLGNIRQRIVSISKDGGQSWSKTYFDQQLPDPVCQGSILNIGRKKGKAVLAFCNAANTTARDNLTLRISFDEGKTWGISKVVAKSPEDYKGDYTAYSDLVKLSEDRVGVFFEKDNYREIVFKSINWK
ncbi:sialidase family protein [Pedobacter sp.]|jgi:sialidase-1|uniref:sialidase family protein n=1 Tax=Pedobacter sp. TaxID=1411316 RepID=UPI002BCFF432|nr:sialidase family protein [Pedobacter sp.]HWW42928.1 sialidase family protein [Pedobacter sp.]